MSHQRITPVNELLAKVIFLILPTAIAGYFLFWQASEYFGIIGDPSTGLLTSLPAAGNLSLLLTLFFLCGMVLSAVFYAFRFRFLVPFLLVSIALMLVYKSIDNLATGEFDAFFIAIQFRTFSFLFLLGWLMGWGFMRLRYFSILVATMCLTAFILLIAQSKITTVEQLLFSLSPILLYAVYLVFTTEQLYSYRESSKKLWWFLTRRLLFFIALAVLLLGGLVYFMQQEIKETVDNYGGGGQQGQHSMLKKNKDGTFELEQYTRLRGSLGRNNELLFAAHIDNFFPDSDVPNPLYLTAFHYTLFDTLTETFERDSLIPNNDLFEPKPNKIPLFFTQYDSSVIRNAMGDKLRKTVEVEVYNKALSPATYLAPSTGFFVQPIAIEKDFKDQYISAFRAKSYVSELNSAYFIYNAENPSIKAFQEQRFEVLRNVVDYHQTSKSFLEYYTRMPKDVKYQKITDLAKQITQHATTPVDKVLAIRDYFLSKDENGERRFTYTDNPGIPDIPSASKLMYFLFENKKGYCAYYAGATLFMLRALGIPSRITVGFLTVDRSDKNKGWYWYYADQAHAWVEVYFPGYGWLDFDTTVGNDEAEESPQPDGTPPLQPPKAWLAAEGVVKEIDTLKKHMILRVNSMVFHDKEYTLNPTVDLEMDLKVAAIRIDSISVPISAIVKGDTATAVSYAAAMKQLSKGNSESANALTQRFPHPTPIDEVYLKQVMQQKPPIEKNKNEIQASSIIKHLLRNTVVALGTTFLLLLLLPYSIFRYYRLRYRVSHPQQQSYWAYKASTFYLHQVGVTRKDETPLQYAQRVVAPQFGDGFTQFMNLYLKQKYAQQPLQPIEINAVQNFLLPFLKQVRLTLPWKIRMIGFLKPWRSLHYFVKTTNDE